MSELKLSEEYLNRMRDLLGEEEFSAYLKSFDEERLYGLRVNTAKVTPEAFPELVSWDLKPVPWIPNGFYYEGTERPAKDPYYYAGLYYLQEPSAMTPAMLLPVEPGDRVLDLCGAPGGKSTELGVRLAGKGVLISNDISNSRAKALLKNLELWGISNICVTSETPDKLADVFGPWFDKILIDAPCSGEGMFRKDDDMVKSYEERGPEYYSEIQKEITDQAVRMLAPGGLLLYSTCTFSRCEDEEMCIRDRCMEEHQVTIDGETKKLEEPFFVIATQNPIETAGTYPLPEAQLDRFLMQIPMGLPDAGEERQILERFGKENPYDSLTAVCGREALLNLMKEAEAVYVHPHLMDYLVELVLATRKHSEVEGGVSPRGSLAFYRAARAYALVKGRDYVVPEDIKALAVPVLAHRLVLARTLTGRSTGRQIIEQLLNTVFVPTEEWNT